MSDAHTPRYNIISRFLHWAIVILVILAWISAIVMDERPGVHAARIFHILTGLAILSLLAIRVFWRLIGPPPPPAFTSFGSWLGTWTDPAGIPTQIVLYGLLFATPFAGIALQIARGEPLPFFGVVEIPPTIIPNLKFIQPIGHLHEFLAYALVGLAGFHALSVILHHIVFRDGTLPRMFSQREK